MIRKMNGTHDWLRAWHEGLTKSTPIQGQQGRRSLRASLAPLGVQSSTSPALGPVSARGASMSTHQAKAHASATGHPQPARHHLRSV